MVRLCVKSGAFRPVDVVRRSSPPPSRLRLTVAVARSSDRASETRRTRVWASSSWWRTGVGITFDFLTGAPLSPNKQVDIKHRLLKIERPVLLARKALDPICPCEDSIRCAQAASPD
jgi:hypothetical protein